MIKRSLLIVIGCLSPLAHAAVTCEISGSNMNIHTTQLNYQVQTEPGTIDVRCLNDGTRLATVTYALGIRTQRLDGSGDMRHEGNRHGIRYRFFQDRQRARLWTDRAPNLRLETMRVPPGGMEVRRSLVYLQLNRGHPQSPGRYKESVSVILDVTAVN